MFVRFTVEMELFVKESANRPATTNHFSLGALLRLALLSTLLLGVGIAFAIHSSMPVDVGLIFVGAFGANLFSIVLLCWYIRQQTLLGQLPQFAGDTGGQCQHWLSNRAEILTDAAIDQDIAERLRAEEALRESETRFRTISDASPVGIFVTTPEGRCQYVNARWKSIAGVTGEAAQGEDWSIFIHPEDHAHACQRWRQAVENKIPYDETLRFQRKDGETGWAHVQALAMLTEEGTHLGYVGSVEDVTERRKVEAALQESERRLAEAQDIACMGSYEYDFVTGIVIWSEAIYSLFDRDILLGTPTRDEIMAYYHPDDLEALLALRKQAFADRRSYEIDLRIRQRDGTYRWCRSVSKPVCDENGNPWRIIGTLIDIHERKIAQEKVEANNLWLEQANQQLVEQQAALVEANAQLEQQILLVNEQSVELEAQKLQLHQTNLQLEEMNARLASLASTDGLTGLKNHRAFQERLAESFVQSRRDHRPLSLLLVDVDNFKRFNDTYGHPAGDEVLKRVASTLQSAARASDFVARYGGEEFVLLLPETDGDEAVQVAERVRQMVQHQQWEQQEITVSIGAASLQTNTAAPSILVDEADKALYLSKAKGRNRFTLHAA